MGGWIGVAASSCVLLVLTAPGDALCRVCPSLSRSPAVLTQAQKQLVRPMSRCPHAAGPFKDGRRKGLWELGLLVGKKSRFKRHLVEHDTVFPDASSERQ